MGMENKDLKEYFDKHYQANKAKRLAYSKQHYQANKAKKQQYYQDNKDSIVPKNIKRTILRNKKRRKEDSLYALKDCLRARIYSALKAKGYNKTTKTEQMLGCSFEQFKQHIESKFESWMTWDNRGLYNGLPNYGWDVDHIIPVSSAKTIEELHKLCHYTNLQPLCSYINRDIKRNKQ